MLRLLLVWPADRKHHFCFVMRVCLLPVLAFKSISAARVVEPFHFSLGLLSILSHMGICSVG